MKKLAFLLLLIGLWSTPTPAQSPELMQAYQKGNELYQAGSYAEAITFMEKALEIAEREFGPEHPRIIILFNNLAVLYHAQGRYADAEPLFKRSLGIRKKALGPDHPDTATGLENYAALIRATGRDAKADELDSRVRAIRARHAKENPAK